MSEQNPDRGLVLHAGPVSVDVPRSLGYYGGIAVAVGAGMIEPPLALFIGAIPLVKMLMRGSAPQPLRFLGQVFDGAAQPVGGDAEGTIRLEDDSASSSTGGPAGDGSTPPSISGGADLTSAGGGGEQAKRPSRARRASASPAGPPRRAAKSAASTPVPPAP